jgi:hypothetical protein
MAALLEHAIAIPLALDYITPHEFRSDAIRDKQTKDAEKALLNVP